MASIKDKNILERWFATIGGAQGQSDKVLRDFMERVNAANIPGLTAEKKTITVGLGQAVKGIFRGGGGSKPREFIAIENEGLPAYIIYAGARDYGNQLIVSWYLIADEKRLGRAARIAGDMVNLINLDMVETEELSAWVSIVHGAITSAVEEMMKGLNLDFTKIDTYTKGFLNLS